MGFLNAYLSSGLGCSHVRPNESLQIEIPAQHYRRSRRGYNRRPAAPGSTRLGCRSDSSNRRDASTVAVAITLCVRRRLEKLWGLKSWKTSSWCGTGTCMFEKSTYGHGRRELSSAVSVETEV